jgi:hypothetical protein
VLRRYSDALALAYVSFKVVEATMLVVAAAALLSLLPLSERYLAAGAPDASSFEAIAETVLAQQFWASRLAAVAYLVATPILDVVLYQTRLVPRPLSVFGFVALILLAIGLLSGAADPTRGFEPAQLLVVPIILWELTFATWLIAKGLSPAALAPAPVRSAPPGA